MVTLLIVTYVLGALAAMRVAYVADARTQDEPSWGGAAMWGLVWPGVVLHRLALLAVRAIGWMLRQTLYRETKPQRNRRLEREKKLAHETAIMALHESAPELLSYEHKQEVLEILSRKKNEALLAKRAAELEKQRAMYRRAYY
jgi:heme/copper-type cytochrome/quinol oxidase subunit 2